MKKDAIIILGCGVKSDGSLPEQAKLRVEKGIELYKNGLAPHVIMSGAFSFLSKCPPITEAEAMAEYAVLLGANKNNMLIEKESRTTIGNAYLTKMRFLEQRNLKKIIVVTSDYHMPKTKYIFKKVLGKNYSITFISSPNQLSKRQLQNELKSQKDKFAVVRYLFETLKEFLGFDR